MYSVAPTSLLVGSEVGADEDDRVVVDVHDTGRRRDSLRHLVDVAPPRSMLGKKRTTPCAVNSEYPATSAVATARSPPIRWT
jgi:hypothetical protein